MAVRAAERAGPAEGFPFGALTVDYRAVADLIPGVVTAHFNAIAGLDVYRDVALIICIGRPLPSEAEVQALTGTFFGKIPEPGYRRAVAGVHMRFGPCRSVGIVQHRDEMVEVIRAAICNDEIVQVIGRGRGVNRSAEHPLEVQVLADVALPMVHDSIVPWEAVVPDVVQQMLLGGIAVDSPADAALLHPALFSNADQAKKAFHRAAFGGQTPLSIYYREMSPKSTAYWRAGRGRSWQRAWWLDGTPDDIRQRLEARLGDLECWRSVQ